ncbi:hypothetical protein Vau01_037340 [Virgisporangium aurantiacum]|uniref:Uncharacterized protein n=1 Tax=Virgisporangium aurantiacum TaxID=175570 RepID=A0A8J4E032_9ACTN|nr:hypothetical protein Vau01_037340 [Virgisporangium aurantiacum]
MLAGMVEVTFGQLDPSRVNVDADRAAADMDRFDHRGSASDERVKHSLPRAAVPLDCRGGQGWTGPLRVALCLRQVPAGALGGAIVLAGGPHCGRWPDVALPDAADRRL